MSPSGAGGVRSYWLLSGYVVLPEHAQYSFYNRVSRPIVREILRTSKDVLEQEAYVMKPICLVFWLVLASGLVACSQMNPISRDQLAENLHPILKIENRVDRLQYYTQMLDKLGAINKENVDALKTHHDIYYVYYVAANVQLARGNMESYMAHVKLAEKELDLMEAMLKDKLSKLSESELKRQSRFSQSGL